MENSSGRFHRWSRNPALTDHQLITPSAIKQHQSDPRTDPWLYHYWVLIASWKFWLYLGKNVHSPVHCHERDEVVILLLLERKRVYIPNITACWTRHPAHSYIHCYLHIAYRDISSCYRGFNKYDCQWRVCLAHRTFAASCFKAQ